MKLNVLILILSLIISIKTESILDPFSIETFIKVENTSNYIDYQNRNLHEINNLVEDSVMRAHYKGGVPCIELTLDEISEETISTLIYFFQLAAAFSGYLFQVNPFDQPGVEVYKEEVRKSLEG